VVGDFFQFVWLEKKVDFYATRFPNFKISHCLKSKHANVEGILSWNPLCTSNGRKDFQHEILDQPTFVFEFITINITIQFVKAISLGHFVVNVFILLEVNEEDVSKEWVGGAQ